MLERREDPAGAVTYRSPLLLELGVPHAFTTRVGPGGGELDVGPLTAAMVECLASLSGAPPGTRAVDLRQVHGRRVLEAGEGPLGAARGDGLVTERPNLLLVVRTADCVPVLLGRLDGGRVAAVHAGWRGLVAGVIPRALEVLGPGEYVAAIGPCLSPARFEVGPEVAAAFAEANLDEVVDRSPPRPHVDLRSAAAIQLERAGVRRIDGTDRCTWEHAAEFWSYRRDVTHGAAERTRHLAALISPRKP